MLEKVNQSRRAGERIVRLANCTAVDLVGHCVEITGPVVLGRLQVAKMNPVLALKQAVGIIIDKQSVSECIVQLFGSVVGVYPTLVSGARYFVGTDSKLTIVPPSPLGGPGSKMFVQMMGVALDAGEFLLDPHAPIVRVGT